MPPSPALSSRRRRDHETNRRAGTGQAYGFAVTADSHRL
jgi:hypothetical protein